MASSAAWIGVAIVAAPAASNANRELAFMTTPLSVTATLRARSVPRRHHGSFDPHLLRVRERRSPADHDIGEPRRRRRDVVRKEPGHLHAPGVRMIVVAG